jgi:chromosome segregation ATPase
MFFSSSASSGFVRFCSVIVNTPDGQVHLVSQELWAQLNEDHSQLQRTLTTLLRRAEEREEDLKRERKTVHDLRKRVEDKNRAIEETAKQEEIERRVAHEAEFKCAELQRALERERSTTVAQSEQLDTERRRANAAELKLESLEAKYAELPYVPLSLYDEVRKQRDKAIVDRDAERGRANENHRRADDAERRAVELQLELRAQLGEQNSSKARRTRHLADCLQHLRKLDESLAGWVNE